MSKKAFIDFIEMAIKAYPTEMPEDAKNYYETLKEAKDNEAPIITSKGAFFLNFFQENLDKKSFTSKDIAEKTNLSSRQISGSLRKLCDDGFLEKTGKSPINYSITEKGKNFDLKEYLNNEEEID